MIDFSGVFQFLYWYLGDYIRTTFALRYGFTYLFDRGH